MIAFLLTTSLLLSMGWIIYDQLVDQLILGEYRQVFIVIFGMASFGEALFNLLVRNI